MKNSITLRWTLSAAIGIAAIIFIITGMPDPYLYLIYKVPEKPVVVDGIEILPRTLWTIAKKHGIPVELLKKVNNIPEDSSTIIPGQEIIVPVPRKFEALVSWYGPGFHGRKTCGGETYDQNDEEAIAHTMLPINTEVVVGGAKAVIKDCGPYPHYLVKKYGMEYENRIFDASLGLAKKIGLVNPGVKKFTVEVLEIPGSFRTLEEARAALKTDASKREV